MELVASYSGFTACGIKVMSPNQEERVKLWRFLATGHNEFYIKLHDSLQGLGANHRMIKVDEADPVGELDPTFPYRDVEIKRGVDMKEFYDLDGEIGRGKFGTVYKCREKGTNLTLAAKFVGIARRQDRKNVEREVEIMRTLQHPRLIQLYDAFETDNVMCVVLELIEGGELFERVIDDDFILTERACTVFMRQICEGVAFIHSNNIIHLDLKPENILCLTKTGNRIKIIDFGLARKFEPDKKLQVLFGTPEFVAPEVVNFDQISCATDMWSVGVICYVLLSGLSPFMGETDVETMANVTVARYDFEDDSFDEISPDAKDFISKLLLKDKEARLTAVECLSHPWLRRQIPPPPPALETTKDNLRNYVEKYVPFSPTPIIVENDFIHNKPGLIEKIIENEQKVINSQCIQKINNDLPVIPSIAETIQEHNLINTEHSLFNSLNQPCNNEKESLPYQVLDNKPSVLLETIQENNIKNNSVPTNNQLPPFFFDNVCPKKEAANLIQQNITNVDEGKSLPVIESNENINNKIESNIVGSLKNSMDLINEKALDNAGMIPKVNNVSLNLNANNNSLNIQNKSIKNDSVNVNPIKPIEFKMKDKATPIETSSDPFLYNQKLDKKLVEKLSTIEEQESQIRSFSRNKIQMKIQEENVASCVNKFNANPSVIVPSKSLQAASNATSDFSFLTLKKDDSFARKNENMFIPEFMKNTTMKKTVNEHTASSITYNDHFPKEPIKESDPHIFKQHLRSTPPWFSELSNNNARKNSGDRFDRRSSDFSCFLNSKEDSESLNLADEIRKLSARLLQMSNNQTLNQNQPFGAYNSNSIPPRTRNDPISCFLENHGIPHPRPKFKFSNLNRDVPIGSPPPPSNLAYYLNVAKNIEKQDSHSAPESPRSSPERTQDSPITNTPNENNKTELFYAADKSNIMTQEKISSKSILEQVHINKTNKKLNFPV